MNYRPFAVALVLVCCSAMSAWAGGPRAVIELFTSQGCSSCPPADKLLGELAHDPSLVAISLPVDYWDYLGWKDTLALHDDSVRQHDYAIARGDREVYTPQVVVNGIVHVLGSDKTAIEQAIARTNRSAHPLTEPVDVSIAHGTVTVKLPAAMGGDDAHRSAEVWLLPITAAAPVSIGRGENRGRTITYHNVVRRWMKLGNWSGEAVSFSKKLAELPDKRFSLADIDRLAVLVQSGSIAKPGLMVGATITPLPKAALQ